MSHGDRLSFYFFDFEHARSVLNKKLFGEFSNNGQDTATVYISFFASFSYSR